MIFAAGLGTRLKPFTLYHPKALVPLCGVPMLQRIIEKLKASGVNEFVVNVHHFANQIVDFLKDNNNFGCEIHISDESDLLLDTGGGILKARKWLEGEEFIVHNADIYTGFSISEMINQHLSSCSDVTLLVKNRSTSRYLLFDENGIMRGWENIKTGEVKPQGIDPENMSQLAFGGVHVLRGSIFSALDTYAKEIDKRVFSITPFYVDYCNKLKISGFQSANPYSWFDVGNPETLAAAENSLINIF